MLDSTPGSSRVEIRNDGGSGGKRGGISNGEVLQTQHQTFPTVAKSLSYVLFVFLVLFLLLRFLVLLQCVLAVVLQQELVRWSLGQSCKLRLSGPLFLLLLLRRLIDTLLRRHCIDLPPVSALLKQAKPRDTERLGLHGLFQECVLYFTLLCSD